MIEIQLLRALESGIYCSGEALGKFLGVTRSAVWKHVQLLQSQGVPIDSAKGRGYYLRNGVELLCGQAEVIGASVGTRYRDVKAILSTPSTNSYLLKGMSAAELSTGDACLLVADGQTGGRGRRGRSWHSPIGRNLYMSVGYCMGGGAAALQGLSLAVGVVLAQYLNALSGQKVRLKWPNDLLYDERKLGGILLEMSGDLEGPCNVVVGVGLNLSMSLDLEASTDIDQPWCDLRQVLGDSCPTKKQLVVELANRLYDLLANYERQGFAEYQSRWNELNAFQGQKIEVSGGAFTLSGVCEGVDSMGSLLLRTKGGEQHKVTAGEVSVKVKQ